MVHAKSNHTEEAREDLVESHRIYTAMNFAPRQPEKEIFKIGKYESRDLADELTRNLLAHVTLKEAITINGDTDLTVKELTPAKRSSNQ